MKYVPFGWLLAAILIWTSCEQTVTLTQESAHWEYEHPDWQDIGYQSCGGNAQSPINIDTDNTIVNEQMPELSFDYQPFRMIIVDNSHTIQVMPAEHDNDLIYNGVRYSFLQLHFHHQSEHQIDDRHAAMELHCVHGDADGNLLVLTFMMEEGAPTQFIDEIFNNIPSEKRQAIETDVQLDIRDILPAQLSYYTYYGSLTTPPCSATVQFVVLKEPLTASAQQISRFSAVYFANYRMIQPLNNRLVLEKPN